MSDDVDRASEREAQILADALRNQTRRAGLEGKTEADSATHCDDCGDRIPVARRRALPGCRVCVACKAREEKKGIL